MATVGRLLTRSPPSGEPSTSAVAANRTDAPQGRGARGLGEARRPAIRAALLDAVPAWVAARAVVGVSLFLAHLSVSTVRAHDAAAAQRVHEGLLSWDAGWYQAIAAHGYSAAGTESLRFFPAFPMAARALSWVPGVTPGAALLFLSNLSALAAMAALGVLVRIDLGDADLARRAVWLMALAPAAYTFVLGYADSSLLLLAVLTVLAARRGWWWGAALAGLGAGLVRPLGVLLAVPVLVEAVRPHPCALHGDGSHNGGRAAGPLAARATAVIAPLAGAAGYMAWVGAQFGDPWLPLRVQQQHGHRGPLTAPLTAMWHDATSVVHGHHLGSALHVPWVALSVVLLVVAYRRLPASYAALATAVLAVSLTSSNLDSFERYALGAFPLVVAASTLTARRRVEVVVLLASGAAMAAYALAAFYGAVVP